MRNVSIATLCTVALLASACDRGDGGSSTSKGSPLAASARADTPPTPTGISVEEASAALPGIPFEKIPPHLRETLVTVAKDEFVFDGSPYTLAGCIKEDYACKDAAIRGLNLITHLLNAGASRSEALTTYNRYYRSFDKSRRATIDVSDAACKGPANAPVTVVEFSDFECPHCAAARPVLTRFVESRSDTRLCFLHYPLPNHQHSSSAAQATVFAHKHGKFWELHDKIFENQQRLNSDVIKNLVAQVGLDPQELVKAVQSDELSKVVDRHKAEGQRLGIQGTPSIFVNGRKLELPLNSDFLRFTVEEELVWMYNGGGWASR